jgi:hypothetical protein
MAITLNILTIKHLSLILEVSVPGLKSPSGLWFFLHRLYSFYYNRIWYHSFNQCAWCVPQKSISGAVGATLGNAPYKIGDRTTRSAIALNLEHHQACKNSWLQYLPDQFQGFHLVVFQFLPLIYLEMDATYH